MCVGIAHGYALRRDFAHSVVGANEEVEAPRVEVDNPSERRAERAVGIVYRRFEPFYRRNVCRQASLRPGMNPVDSRRRKQAEFKVAIGR